MKPETLRNLRSMVREAIAVLAAILAAFALDAWWDARVERAEALDLLRSVDDRMEAHIAQIDSVHQVNSEAIEWIRAVVALEPAEVASISTEDLYGRYGRFGDFQTLNPELGAVRALTTSDVFGGIQDEELRTALTSVPALWDDAMEEGEAVEDLGDDAAIAIFEYVGPELRVGLLGEEAPDEAGLRDLIRALVATPRSRARWAAIGIFGGQYLEELDRLKARLEEIRGQIAEELAA